jgi:DNA-binding winged helix-turn-helix (wHTH) protein/Tol biopolymer transport system component
VSVDDPPVERSSQGLRFGPVTLIPAERLVLKDGRSVPLTPKAFDLLAFMAAHPGRLLTKDELMQAVWPDAIVEESNLSYNVFAIRKALGEGEETERYVETVPKRGYRFLPQVIPVDDNGNGPSKDPQVPPDAIAAGNDSDRVGTQETEVSLSTRLAHVAPARATWRPWILLASGLAIGALAAVLLGPQQDRMSSVRPLYFQEPVWGQVSESGVFSISPDGQHVVLATAGPDGVMQFWVRTMSALAPSPLAGSDVFTIAPPVIWSPDSRFLAFTGAHGLRKISLSGGTPQTICETHTLDVGGDWNRDGVILLGNPTGGVFRCSVAGGGATLVTHPEPSNQEIHLMPSFLSDGRRFIYLRIVRSKPEQSGIYVGDLGPASAGQGKRLIATGFPAKYVPAADDGSGYIVFALDGALFAQRFDEAQLTLTGEPSRLADRIGSYLDWASFAVSTTTLVYRAPEPPFQLTWFDRQGRDVGHIGSPEHVAGLALSPDGGHAIVAKHAPQSVADQDLWLFDLTRQANPIRQTFTPTLEFWPLLVTNNRFVYGLGGGDLGLYQQTIGGDRQLLFKTGRVAFPTSVTSDGRVMLFTTFRDAATGFDVWVWTAEGPKGGAPLVAREFHQTQAQLSRDGRRVAYVSNESGRNEVFVADVRIDPAIGSVSVGDGLPISDGGGFAPRWRGDGRELFYLTIDGAVMTVEVDEKGASSSSTSRKLFNVPGVMQEWGVTKDGSRFLFAVPVGPTPPLTIVPAIGKRDFRNRRLHRPACPDSVSDGVFAQAIQATTAMPAALSRPAATAEVAHATIAGCHRLRCRVQTEPPCSNPAWRASSVRSIKSTTCEASSWLLS